MGGRRAPTLRDALGGAEPPRELERELNQGLARRDPQAIFRAASELAPTAIAPDTLASYLRLLVPFIKKELAAERKQPDLRVAVKAEWSKVKKKHAIHANDTVNNSVVQAVIAFLKARSE